MNLTDGRIAVLHLVTHLLVILGIAPGILARVLRRSTKRASFHLIKSRVTVQFCGGHVSPLM